ncbi:MAG: hypothetical protein CBB71_15180 [Rhodopirellula sp. TMED11]|nr:MAG: hypothetical protein CBB71_15180 [Rhodopirellula sp. TMED11]
MSAFGAARAFGAVSVPHARPAFSWADPVQLAAPDRSVTYRTDGVFDRWVAVIKLNESLNEGMLR